MKSQVQLLDMLFYFWIFFFFPDSLLGISRRMYSQMGTISFRKSTISYWCWKSKWSIKYYSEWNTAIISSHTLSKTCLVKLNVKVSAGNCRNFRNRIYSYCPTTSSMTIKIWESNWQVSGYHLETYYYIKVMNLL